MIARHRLLMLRVRLLAIVLLISGSNAIAAAPRIPQESKRTPEGGIFKWNGQEWTQVPGSGFKISVGPDGSPWMVQYQGNIYRWVNGGFERMPGRARDIGVGANGAVWIIGWDSGIYRWNGQGWDRVPGAGVTISVQSNGAPWIVNSTGEIYRWVTDHFEPVEGRARDIGAEKSIWVIDQDGLVYNWSHGSWLKDARAGIATAGNAKRITIGPDGSPWVVNTAREIYQWTDGTFQKFPGSATDIGVGADRSVWMVGIPGTSSSQIGGKIGSMMGGAIGGGAIGSGEKKDSGPIVGVPPKSDADPLSGRSSKSPVEQKFRYAPSAIPDTDAVTFKFITTQPTIPIIEVSRRPPEPGPRFEQGSVVSAVFPAAAGKQTKHELRVEKLKPATRYHYIITIADENGKLITDAGEFTTSVRMDRN